MPSITGWTRLEPQPYDTSMADALQARLHDPLWLLARQWQLGEFEGEDAGSPVRADVSALTGVLSRYGSGRRSGAAFSTVETYPQGLPLETLVEREPLQNAKGLPIFLALEAGQELFRLLRRVQPPLDPSIEQDLLADFALQLSADQLVTLDSESKRFFTVLNGRALDGQALHTDLATANHRKSVARLLNELPEVVERWRKLYEELYGSPIPTTAWDDSSLEYRFGLAANDGQKERALYAPEYTGGRLDWYAFDCDPSLKLGAPAAPTISEPNRSFIPTALRFAGMPNARYWEFEEGQMNLAQVEAGPEDLARLLLVEFMLVYGNDFFAFPMEMEAGSVCTITDFKVIDTFGQVSDVPPSSAGADHWSMFTQTDLSKPDKPSSTFFLAPALVQNLSSSPIEELAILRDEMANMCWAVQRLSSGPAGLPLDYGERHSQQPLAEPKAARTGIAYRLASLPPTHWIPLVPTLQSDGRVLLEEGQLWQQTGKRSENVELGALLRSIAATAIPLSEVSREGLQLTRTYQYTRAWDGNTYLWIGRRKRPGRGEGSSGLRYDFLEDIS